MKELFLTQQKLPCALLHSTIAKILLEEGLEPKSNIFDAEVVQYPAFDVLYKLMHVQNASQ